MPCVYHETPEEILAYKKAKRKVLDSKYKRELDLVTGYLCYVLTKLAEIHEHNALLDDVIEDNKGLVDWWENHQKMDELRRKELIASAKSKLNKEEIEALGLNSD